MSKGGGAEAEAALVSVERKPGRVRNGAIELYHFRRSSDSPSMSNSAGVHRDH